MKPLLFTLLFSLCRVLYAPGVNTIAIVEIEAINPYSDLIKAIVKVESNNNDSAYNEKENAVGAFQIREIRLQDYNQRTGNNYTLQDCYDYELSERIFMYYAAKYHHEDIKAICIGWNGKSKRNKYYSKVIKQLKN